MYKIYTRRLREPDVNQALVPDHLSHLNNCFFFVKWHISQNSLAFILTLSIINCFLFISNNAAFLLILSNNKI